MYDNKPTIIPLEETHFISDYKVLTEAKDPVTNQWDCTIETVLQKLDDVNNNGRIYSKELMSPVINSIQPLVKSRHLVGEWGHPVTEAGSLLAAGAEQYLKRISTIDPKFISHMITKIWIDGQYIRGHVKTLHTTYGFDMANFILRDKGTIGFSLRALGNSEKRGQYQYIVKNGFIFITYDAVFRPSNESAKFNPSTNQFITSSLTESTNLCKDGLCPIVETYNVSNSKIAKLTAKQSLLREGVEYLKRKIL